MSYKIKPFTFKSESERKKNKLAVAYKTIRALYNSQFYQELSIYERKALRTICRTILSSHHILCNKSKYSLAKEAGVGSTTIVRVRKKLTANGQFLISNSIKYGDVRPRDFTQVVGLYEERPKLTKGTYADWERREKLEALSDEEFDNLTLFDLLNTNDYKFAVIEDVKLLAMENYYVYAPSDLLQPENWYFSSHGQSPNEFKYIRERSKAKRKREQELPIPDMVSVVDGVVDLSTVSMVSNNQSSNDNNEKVGKVNKHGDLGMVDFASMDNYSKAACMEASGFMVVPANGKKMYAGYDSLSNRGRKRRLQLAWNCMKARTHVSWQGFYAEKMGEESFRHFDDKTFGKMEFQMRRNNYKWNYEYYHQHGNLGIILRKNQVCIDIDHKDNYLMSAIRFLVPDCLIQETKRGYHIFVTDKHKVFAGINKILNFIDIKKHKTHVVIANTENDYRFIHGSLEKIGNLPEDFLCRLADLLRINPEDFFETAAEDENNTSEDGNECDSDDSVNVDPARNNAIKGKFKLPDYVAVGERNYTTMRYSFSLRARGYDLETIEYKLRGWLKNSEMVEECLPEAEIRAIMNYVRRKPNDADFIQRVPMFSIHEVVNC